jgi:tetratricopeptide (TPR) repeat protein
MNPATKPKLLPNPYKRSPIKKLEDLAGRARERKAIRYYLNLTATGDSPHLALIGQRGVGKTSLLNGADAIARELKLLPVRLDMNELKAKSPGRFWHDLYQTLALSMAKAGCWGGEQGAIYAELLRMIHSRQPGNLEKAVMQIPYVFSCHQGNIDTFECPDALVVNDFNACLTELRTKGFTGIALLIDEADCLGKNVPLLQMFRNIFQVVDHCSLVLAGTEAVFPALSEVFSPIPRQFYRVDVKPFARWSDTMDLVLRPLPKELFEAIAPKQDVLQELHQLCGGAPDEVQLYCHHMYRSVEDGSSKRMNLSPQVFREVLREYRSNSPANVDAVLNAIEKLPDDLLFKSNWMSRRTLTLDENIQVSILRRQLRQNKILSADVKASVAKELSEGYRKLFDAGIIELNNCIRLTGSPLTAGFWKSYVNVERGKRWSWNDESFADNLLDPITNAIGVACAAVGRIDNIHGTDAVVALKTIRDGKIPGEFDEGMGEMIASALYARDNKSTYVAELTLQMESPAGRNTFQTRYFEKGDVQISKEKIQDWIDTHVDLLAGCGISIVITAFDRWELPTALELHRLGDISGYRIPKVFGPTRNEQAVSMFANGDISGCVDTFKSILADSEDAFVRNNLAFCQILTGEVAAGLASVKKALEQYYEPLLEMNKGIAEYLQGDIDEAKKSLCNALQQLRDPEKKFEASASFVLVLELGTKKVSSHKEIPLDVAISLNLWRIGHLTREELEAELTKLYSEKAQAWLATFTV